ncbi:hypothetical protein BURPS305_2813 [Burkholderia pseudomallei 305]|nr:hypothetical protein BURPS305_2813 [Burkholderia pseudomallei 305]
MEPADRARTERPTRVRLAPALVPDLCPTCPRPAPALRPPRGGNATAARR